MLAGASGGERGQWDHSSGNTLPLIARPWGFNHWSPQSTAKGTSWWFDADSSEFRGIRCTHQPSPWIGDWAWFLLRPLMGHRGDDWLGFVSYRADGAMKPYQMDLTLGPMGIRTQLVPTIHGAVWRVSFPRTVHPSRRRACAWVPEGEVSDRDAMVLGFDNTGSCEVVDGGINLVTRRFADGVTGEMNFGLHARLEAEGMQPVAEIKGCFEDNFIYQPLDMPGTVRTEEGGPSACYERCASTRGCAHFTYFNDGGCHLQDKSATKSGRSSATSGPNKCPDTRSRQCCFILGKKAKEVDVYIGTSLISAEQAAKALEAEVRGKTLEQLAALGRNAWRTELLQIEVLDAGPPEASTWRRIERFYTGLYRVLLFPRRLDELTPHGVQHWSPYNGQVLDGPGVTDNGFWDTFRTVYPLLALAYPRQLGEIVEGWLNAYRAGEWLPKWASPSYRDSMVGTFADVVIADAIIKNISGFSLTTAWEALKKDSYEPHKEDTSKGKFGISEYLEKGYIPVDVGISEACSRTLDFAFADAAVAAAAERLGHATEAADLQRRSVRALESIYDVSTGLMGHRKNDGTFVKEAANTWGDGFTEGSAWHHSFPPFNLTTLTQLHGGPEKLWKKLKSLFEVPGDFRPGSYRDEIHEMKEMRMLGLGQYAHNNQPAHHLPYLFSMLGDQNTTAKLVRQIMARAYSTEGFAGDEDNGEMGAWFVLSALGLYAPGTGTTPDYVLGAVPLFPRVRLRSLDIYIEAASAAEEVPAVLEVLWRSRPVAKFSPALSYGELRRGGTLRFISPSDARLGRIVSSLRGALHQVAKAAQKVTPQPWQPTLGSNFSVLELEALGQLDVAEEEVKSAPIMSILVFLLGSLLLVTWKVQKLHLNNRKSKD